VNGPSRRAAERKPTADWFKNWSNEYDETLGKMTRHHRMLELAVRLSRVRDGERVLDIGCGTGLLSLTFLRKADCRVLGIDASGEMLSYFEKKIAGLSLGGRVECAVGDAASMKFKDATFDVIASTVALHHVKDKEPVIRRIFSMLKPRGRFVLGELDMDTTGELTDVRRLKRILAFFNEEWTQALKDGGVEAFRRMYDNGRKHILNDGEYCVSFHQWKALCRKAGFEHLTVKPVAEASRYKVLTAVKPAPPKSAAGAEGSAAIQNHSTTT
jgi:ubiquinone/menaquinone biosynthesis C-methylase UbiE